MSTVVSVHAHPDDEALLTGGSLAKWHAEGHRVVVVTATDGGRGMASDCILAGDDLASLRRRELERSCAALGVDRLVCLGMPDSGMAGRPVPGSFATRPVRDVARRIREIIRLEHADIVTGYDRNGGYGHRDHQQVHRAVRRVCRDLPELRLLEATVDRVALQRALRLIAWLPRLPEGFDPARFENTFSAPADITDVVDVRSHTRQKRAAFDAHRTQSFGDDGRRALAWFRRLPQPVFDRVFGREWFVAAAPLRDQPVTTPSGSIQTGCHRLA